LKGRPGKVIALEQLNPEVLQGGQFPRGFNALGNNLNGQVATDLEDAVGDCPASLVGVDIADQGHVQLDQVGVEFRQQIEAGIAGAKIVDGGEKAPLLIVLNDAAQMADVGHLCPFGDLENDALNGKAEVVGSRQGGANTKLRAIHRIGHEIDTEEGVHPQLAGALDGLDAAGLVKSVAVALVDMGEHLAGRFVVQAPNQGFLGEYLAGGDIDYGLISHGEIKVQACALGAFQTAEFAIIFLNHHGWV